MSDVLFHSGVEAAYPAGQGVSPMVQLRHHGRCCQSAWWCAHRSGGKRYVRIYALISGLPDAACEANNSGGGRISSSGRSALGSDDPFRFVSTKCVSIPSRRAGNAVGSVTWLSDRELVSELGGGAAPLQELMLEP